jgi:hypothetical protein
MSLKNIPLLATILLIGTNVLDTFFTIKYIKYGPLDEGNPIMDLLLQSDSCLFAFIKIFIPTIFTIFLYLNSDKKFSRYCLYILTGFYFALIIWWILVILLI